MTDILITTEALREVEGPHLHVLKQGGYRVRYPAKTLLLTEDDTLEAMASCVGVIAGSEPYTDRVLAGLPQLKIISRNGVGYDRIDVPAATRRGVAVTITPEGNHQAVAEHAMALILAVARSIVQSAIETRAGIWRRRGVHIPLRGKTLGIVGLGRIGRSVAVRASAFGMRVVAYETFPDTQFVERYDVKLLDFESLLAESDFVSLHTPMSTETQGLINRRAIEQMKPGSFLINTARGGLVDEAALLDALRSGHLAGAGLDVLAVEPPQADHPLLQLDNVIVSPHVSALDSQAIEDMAVGAAQNIVDILQGKWPAAAVINPEVKAAWKP
jgi:D-3-phosphoglycerate dehydrogenase / 2-oxoglutarate reductase